LALLSLIRSADAGVETHIAAARADNVKNGAERCMRISLSTLIVFIWLWRCKHGDVYVNDNIMQSDSYRTQAPLMNSGDAGLQRTLPSHSARNLRAVIFWHFRKPGTEQNQLDEWPLAPHAWSAEFVAQSDDLSSTKNA
jgi:hypothetical protein